MHHCAFIFQVLLTHQLLAGQEEWTPSRLKTGFLLVVIVLWHAAVVVIPWLWDRSRTEPSFPKPSFPWPNFIANTPSFIVSSTMLSLYMFAKGTYRGKFLHCAKRVFADFTNASTGSIASV